MWNSLNCCVAKINLKLLFKFSTLVEVVNENYYPHYFVDMVFHLYKFVRLIVAKFFLREYFVVATSVVLLEIQMLRDGRWSVLSVI